MARQNYKYGNVISDKTRPAITGTIRSITEDHYVVMTDKGRRWIRKENATRRIINSCGKKTGRMVVATFGYDNLYQRAIDEGVSLDALIESLR